MTDFASIGIEMDSRPVVEGTKALDALGEASVRVEQKIRVSNGQMSDTTKIMQAQADQAKAAAQANAVLGGSTSSLTAGQVQLIERFREQAAVVGMSRSQLMAYQAAQMGVTEQTKGAIAAIKAQEDALKAAAQAKEDAAKKANILTDALKLLASGYAALKIADFIKDSAMQAARYETLGVVMGVVGKTAGYTKVQMEVASEAIAAQGITMLEARSSAIKLVQAHVDLSNATKLARIAQDAAVIGNINSSEAFDRLVNGVSRGNVLILRNIGINVNLQAAYQQMAESLGKSSKELTENERVQARLNAVMERGTDIAGTYQASMDTAGKQILSMNRYVSDLKTTFGETFNEVLTIAVMALTDNLKDANGEVTQLAKNGQLADWGHDLTKIFVTLANEVSNAFTTFQKFDAWARHLDARKAINADADAQSKAVSDSGNGMAEKDAFAKVQRIEAVRRAALAEENADYVKHQAELSGNFDRFQRAADERESTRLAKQKKDADERLKVDQDYATRATALLIANADKSLQVQQAAQAKLAKEVYQGTPHFRDTEGRESAPKTDQADAARLQNKLARIEEESAIDKRYAEFQMQLDDQRHKAGELGDDQYFKNRKGNLATIYLSEQGMYDKELAALRAHHNSTEAEAEKNQKAIDDVLGKQNASRTKYEQDGIVADDAERLRQKAVEQASQDATNKYTSDLQKQLEAIDAATGKHQKSKSAVEEETVALYQLAVANMKAQVSDPITADHTQADHDAAVIMLADLEKELGLHRQIAGALRDQEAVFAHQKLADQAIQDWQRAGASISQSLSSAFGAGGKAIGEMFKAYADGQAGQLRAMKDLAYAKDKLPKDSPEQIAATQRAQLAGTEAQLKSYGDMADAAQGFFDQGSKGYAAMHAASQVLHAAEVALSVVKGVNAVLTQGEGDPYSAFARMAAMTALVAGLGVALSGGSGGGMSAADRQKSQGTGTVLGDSSAKSDSIAHSVALAAANSSTQINYLSGMLTALRGIETNIGSLSAALAQNPNISSPNVGNINTNNGLAKTTTSTTSGGIVFAVLDKIPAVGNFFSKIGNSIFGGNQSVEDSGFTMNKESVASILAQGANAKTYADVKTNGGWFHSDKHDTKTTALDAAANQQITAVIGSMGDSIKEAGKLLGICGDDFTNRLNGFVVDIGKVSLKGLTGEEQQKALEAVFSKLGDQMAQYAVAGLSQFQKVGEGYLETLTRVATDYAKVDASLQSIGKTFGATGIASIKAREDLIALMGGIDTFQSQTAGFASNFLSKAEQLAPVAKYVDQQLAALGLTGLTTRDQFKQVVLGLDLTTASGQKEYAALMQLQDAFAATHAATVDLSKTEQEIADERKGLQDQLDQLTMSQAQLLTKQRNALDASNRALFDQVQAAQKAKDAQDASKTSLGNLISQMTSFRDSTKALHDSLLTGSLTTLSPEQQYAELRRQYEQTKAKASAGDVASQNNYANALNAFLTFSQKINGGDSQYQADFAMGQNDSAAMSAWAANQVDVNQAQLDAMNSQVAAMNAANATLTSIAQGIDNLPVALSSTPINPANYGNSDGIVALVTEVKSLNAKIDAQNQIIAGLRADQQKQAGDNQVANDKSQQAAAETVVDGLGGIIHKAVSGAQKVALE